MSQNVTFNGSSYTIPEQGESQWGTNVTNYLVAIASHALQKSGGSFTLTADVDFGATYGLKAVKFASRNTPSITGIMRLGNNELVGWRNAANSADLALKVNASDILEFAGNPVFTLALGAADSVLRMNAGGTAYEFSKLVNANIDASAAIAYSKLNLATSIVNADVNASAAIDWSKLSKAGSNLTDIATRSHTALSDIGTNTHAQIDTHLANTSNPHSVTKAQVGLTNVDDTSDATKNAATVALTNKTLTAPQINGGTASNTTQWIVPKDTTSNLASLTKTEAALVYSSDDDTLLVGDGTDWNPVGSGGSGSGSRNYLSAWFDGAKSVGTVTNSITATGNITASAVWKASDTTKLTVANAATGGLRETKSLKLDHVAVGAGFVQTPEFALDTMDLGKPVSVSFDHGTVTAADDYQVYMVRYNSSGTYQEQIAIAGTASATSPYSAQLSASSVVKFQGFFIAGSTSTDLYALRFYRNNAADTTDVLVDSLYVGPNQVVQGAVVTDWQYRTPVVGDITNNTSLTVGASSAYRYRQIGDSMHIQAYYTFGADGTSASQLAINIGSIHGLTFTSTQDVNANMSAYKVGTGLVAG